MTEKLGTWFETKRRDPEKRDTSYVTLKDGAPEWLRAAVYEAHDGLLPNDWVYAECEAACDFIDEYREREGSLDEGDMHDALFEHCDGRVDVYNSAVFGWAAELCNSDLFAAAEERLADMGQPDPKEGEVKRLQQLQFYAIDIIANVMIEAAKEHGEDAEDEEDPSDLERSLEGQGDP